MREPRHRVVFKRFETDEEFRRRLDKVGLYTAVWLGGTALDEMAWEQRQMQRRIIEDVA